MIPQEFINAYNLKKKFQNWYISAQVTNGMYVLPQEGWIAHDALFQHLTLYVYHPSSKTLGLWTHDSCPVNFTLVVNDFCVKYPGKEYALHLKAALEDNYKVATYW